MDWAATAPLDEKVKGAIIEAMDVFGNPSSMHARGREALLEVRKARAAVADLIGADSEEILFTSGGSEANNMALWGFEKVAVSEIEHPSVLKPAKNKNARLIPVDGMGRVRKEELEKILRDGIELVSVMMINNETGVRQDIEEISKVVHAAGVLLHVDAVQAVGKMPIDVRDLEVDLMTVSAHKIGGPKGIGALYIREGIKMKPLIVGGGQERKLRAGTYDTLGIIGFGEATKQAERNLPKWEEVRRLRNSLKDKITDKVEGVLVNSPDDGSPNILNVSFLGAEGESILLMLDAQGIEVSTGSACASDSLAPSHVIMAMSGDAEVAHGSVRFSLGLDTTEEDIEYVSEVLPEIIKKLRSLSTVRR